MQREDLPRRKEECHQNGALSGGVHQRVQVYRVHVQQMATTIINNMELLGMTLVKKAVQSAT